MSQKVTINPPGQQPSAPGNEQTPDNVVIDSRGRRLVIEEPDFLTESRIMRAIGDAASNQSYVMAYVMPAVMVVQIDDARLPPPVTNQQVEAAIARVGREGMVAVLTFMEAKAKAAQGITEEQGGDGSGQVDALKNS